MQHFYTVDMLHLAQRYIHNVLSRCLCNNSHTNASQFYVIRLSSICSCLLSYRPPLKMTTAGFPETSVPTKLRHFTSYKSLMFSLPCWRKANRPHPANKISCFPPDRLQFQFWRLTRIWPARLKVTASVKVVGAEYWILGFQSTIKSADISIYTLV